METLRYVFAARLAERRTLKGWGQREMGKKFDPPMDGAYINKLEQGLFAPTLDTVERFARVLGVPPHKLLK